MIPRSWTLLPGLALLFIGLGQWLSARSSPGGEALSLLGAFGGACCACLLAVMLGELRRSWRLLARLRLALGRRERARPTQTIIVEAVDKPGTRRLPAVEEARRLQQLRRLQRQVEILSSMRDLSLIANDEAELEGVLNRSFDVIQRLFEATEVQIFLVETRAPDQLHLAGVRRQKQTRLAPATEPMRFQGARKDALSALEERRATTRFVGQRLCAVSVLRANHEAIGVLVVYIPRRGREEAWAAQVLAELADLTKHVSLVIHKPALYDRAVMDALTGLYSKRHFLDQVPKSMSAARRVGTPLCLIVIDIDHFKSINDTHGHVTGDIVLAASARMIKDAIRDYDMAYRFGGEEMCVVAPNTEMEGALGLAERIRARFEEATMIGEKGQSVRITASFGVARFELEHEKLEDLLAQADSWLYAAKREGRNQVRPHLSEHLSKALPPAAEARPAKPKEPELEEEDDLEEAEEVEAAAEVAERDEEGAEDADDLEDEESEVSEEPEEVVARSRSRAVRRPSLRVGV